ncbi:hypothetical protein [Novosphingobium sp. PY1]|uniref:Uncharacterized protein n=1 Tax=Ochrobactrum sp. PW1 TaxID=1882222 RepID=A0A292GS93_9HYPH|nr:hypothetical protein [Novosphingobium sp. PY1]BBA74387.1 hypothetical protein [Ochrobactrum sp. PW1]GFM29236.1 uncharacterized protein PY1_contig-07-162 [Novosphingobium sp. PY1]
MTKATGIGRGRYAANSLPKGLKQYPQAIVDRVRTLYLSGLSQKEVSAEMGIGFKVVQRVMINHGIPRRAQAKRNQIGPANTAWKGDQAQYQALHLRVATLRGKPSNCEQCGTKTASRYEWANLTGNYHDVNDYRRMCVPCHRTYDNQRKRDA